MCGLIKTRLGGGAVKKRSWSQPWWRQKKIYAAVDLRGKPVSLAISFSYVHDNRGVKPVVRRLRAKAFVADRAYDSHSLRAWLRTRGMRPVIPSRCNRLSQERINQRLYRQRYKVEMFLHRLKRWRRVATRFEKRAETHMSIIQVAAIGIQHFEDTP